MTNKSAPTVTACAAYRSNEAAMRLAKTLAAEHGCAVHVGRYVNEDTGETSPAFFLGGATDRDSLRQIIVRKCEPNFA